MPEIVVLDTSGSMLDCEDRLIKRAKEVGKSGVVLGLNPDVLLSSKSDCVPVEVLSDAGEEVEIELEITGGTPLYAVVEVMEEITNSSYTIVTDGMPHDVRRFVEALERTPNEVFIEIIETEYTDPDSIPEEIKPWVKEGDDG